MKKILVLFIVIFSMVSFSGAGLSLNDPVASIKRDVRVLVSGDDSIKEWYSFIFQDLFMDSSKPIFFRIKMLHVYLFLNTL